MEESINVRPFLVDFFNGEEFYSAPSSTKNPLWIEAAQQIIHFKIQFGEKFKRRFEKAAEDGQTFVFSLDDLSNNFVLLTGKINFI